jgi:hypothetical protein
MSIFFDAASVAANANKQNSLTPITVRSFSGVPRRHSQDRASTTGMPSPCQGSACRKVSLNAKAASARAPTQKRYFLALRILICIKPDNSGDALYVRHADLHPQRHHRHLHIQLLLPAPQHNSPHRRHIAEIASPAQRDVLMLHQAPVGRIEIHPAQ